ncbi:MAG: YfiR/HmsC family protein [Bacteroides sp.]|nr:YfiR/HmsC family protein [Bacteroides sp.]
MKKYRYTFLLLLFGLSAGLLLGQDGFGDKDRALYILDISKYVKFDDSFANKQEFVITVLDRDDQLYWELQRLSETRKSIQGKEIKILLCAKTEELSSSSVVYVNRADEYALGPVLEQISGKNTLLISEGYPFRSSMINFVAVDGKLAFEANEELMNQEGLLVSQQTLHRAIKTLEDWESLYDDTEDELQMEKIITEQQSLLIEVQMNEIKRQEELINENSQILENLFQEIDMRENEIEMKSEVLEAQEDEIKDQNRLIRDQIDEVRLQRETLVDQEKSIREKEMTILTREEEIGAQELQIGHQEEKIVLQAEAIQKQRIIIIAAGIAILLVIGLGYLIWINYRNKKRANVLLRAQRDQIAFQKKHITDSINYAEKIQRAILPALELFTDKLEHFVLFKPRDIVSGDFYWVEEVDGRLVIIAADCTGHGVPGAFMSMLGISLLNEIILNKRITEPDEILNNLRTRIIKALKQGKDGFVKDGMDMTVCVLDRQSNTLLFSGANNPLYHIRDGELKQIKGDKMPVSIHELMDPFTLHEVKLQKGDTFYTFSDGYADQFGGPAQKKFLAKNFRKLLLKIQGKSMMDQGIHLDQSFETYRNDLEQIDDVVVIGVKY